ncbi:MAG TPA: DUF454 family protein [Pirellulales bacterium]|nr:DUF454 family protein [Pirellulales bacterium]
MLRLSSQRLFSPSCTRHTTSLAACALELAPVVEVRSYPKRGWLEIAYRSELVEASDLLRRLSEALRAKVAGIFAPVPAGVDGQAVLRIVRGDSGIALAPEHELADGWKRWVFRVLAVSGLGMTIFAFLVPAVPTPPFLAATMYFSIRSSPALKHWLEQSWMFGRMIADWREHRGVRPIVKIKSLLISYAILGLVIVLFDMTGTSLYVVLAVAAFNTLLILLLPTLHVFSGFGFRSWGRSPGTVIVSRPPASVTRQSPSGSTTCPHFARATGFS